MGPSRSTDESSSYTAIQNVLPDLKDWWTELNDVYSKVLQTVARRLTDNLHRLKSQNWHAQRRRVARIRARLVRMHQDFLHKLSNYSAREYYLVAVEDLDVPRMVQRQPNSRNRASASWRTFIDFLEDKCERGATHFVNVEPEGTTKECAECGVDVEKELWMREHSCPKCGFETDRDENAAYNALQRGLRELGVGHAEVTPAETALPASTTGGSSAVVDAKYVVETGNPPYEERTASAVSE